MKTPSHSLLAGLTLAILASGAWFATRPATATEPTLPPEGAPLVQITLPDSLGPEALRGRETFEATCAACHGTNATGRMGFGPPLVHPIYEPSHHGDMAFVMAAQNGVRAHHWPFGDMPPQPGLNATQIAEIVAYVRSLQRANGID